MRTASATCMAVLLTLFAACGATTYAQDYPTRPVTFVVPYAPGGGADALARILAGRLTAALGQQFLVENRPGAGGVAGTDYVVKSRPDGYTLLFIDNIFQISPFLMKVPYDPVKDLAPVSMVSSIPLFLIVRPEKNINTLAELVATIRKNPGKLSYGSGGIGSLHHLSFEAFKQELRLDIVHIPYKGSGQSVVAFQTGDVDVLVASLPSVVPLIKAGRAKLLASTSLERSPVTPDVPALAESIAGYNFPNELGVLAPAGTPGPVIAKLNNALAKIAKEPEIIQRLKDLFAGSPVSISPDDYSKNIQKNMTLYKEAVRVSGAKAN